MGEELLTVKEVASLFVCSERSVQLKIKDGKLQHIEMKMTGKGTGRGGIQYRIPLSSLDARMQVKYQAQKKKATVAVIPEADPCTKSSRSIEEFTELERTEISFWMRLLNEWQVYRSDTKNWKNKVKVDEQFAALAVLQNPDRDISAGILRRKWKALMENNMEGLVDMRGKNRKGSTSMPELIWDVFEDYYLDERQFSISKCVEYVRIWAEIMRPDLLDAIPAYDTFYRLEKNISYAVKKYFREGNEAFKNDAAPYITRLYDNIESNDIWVADNHTFDVISMIDGTTKTHRLYVTAYQDIRSRKFVGWYVTDTPNSDANLFALRKAIQKFGIPREIYTDNGREFLCADIGGRGRRRTAKTEGHTPPTILDRLGIKFTNAEVRNGRSKIVERAFKEVKETISRLFNTFTGGSIEERPEMLKKSLKSGKIVLDSKFTEIVDLMFEGGFNSHEHNGWGMYGRTPNQAYAEHLLIKRTASDEELNLMLMRSTRMQTVNEKGVKLVLYGEDLFYWSNEFLFNHQNKKVYVRYNPEDLKEVRVYGENDQFLMTVPCDNETILRYGASKEDIKNAQSKIRSFGKTVKAYKENSGLEAYQRIDALDLMLWKCKKNMEDQVTPEAKVIEVVRANEPTEPVKKAVGDNSGVKVDLRRMVANAKKANMKK